MRCMCGQPNSNRGRPVRAGMEKGNATVQGEDLGHPVTVVVAAVAVAVAFRLLLIIVFRCITVSVYPRWLAH